MNIAVYDKTCVAGRLPLYLMEMTQLKDLISCQRVCLLRKQVSWVVAPCGLVIYSRHLEGKVLPSSSGFEFVY
jgi:hypothetical protein